ncbi:MAG TPA: LLM class flavin-dependent oxidoreductase [Candidatus Limnocylindrales bacterium]|nr:LLM class flavin-dependent oxidoreductase [Candidatus Limnocylindrales bacterium]
MTLQLGVYLTTGPPKGGRPPRWPELRTLAREVEAAGIDTLWVADEPGFWECWTILTAAAEATSRIEIGPLVACGRYRNPALLVTMARALDEVSGGRLALGLGAGASSSDARLAAFGFDPGPAHVARFAEVAEIVSRLLREGPFRFDGAFHSIADPDVGPAGPQPNGPPIWIAAGKPKAMEVAARWADVVNGADNIVDAGSVARLRDAVAAACTVVGRDPRTVRLSGDCRIAVSADGRLDADRADTISGTRDAVAERIAEIAAAGLEHLTCFIGDETDDSAFPALTPGALERLVAIVDRLRSAGVVAAPG